MSAAGKILTVNYGTFACTLKGFDNPFVAMTAIAEYFRDLKADNRYFNAKPSRPDVEVLAKIAGRNAACHIATTILDNGVVISPREQATETNAPLAAAPEVENAPIAAPDDDAGTQTESLIETVATDEPELDVAQKDDAENIVSNDTADQEDTSTNAQDDKTDDSEETAAITAQADDTDVDFHQPTEVDSADEPVYSAAALGFDMWSLDEPTEAVADEQVEDERVVAADDEQIEAHADEQVDTVEHERIDTASDEQTETIKDEPIEAVADKPIEAAAVEQATVKEEQVNAVTEELAETVEDEPFEAAADERAEAIEEEQIDTATDEQAEDEQVEAVTDEQVEDEQDETAEDEPIEAAEDETPSQIQEPAAALDTDVKTSLSPEDEADLAAELAEIESGNITKEYVNPELDRGIGFTLRTDRARRVMRPDSGGKVDTSVERLLDEANTKLETSESTRRQSEISHLRAAAVATAAEQKINPMRRENVTRELEPYRVDLADMVNPDHSEAEDAGPSDSDAPMVLFAEQRVEKTPVTNSTPANPATPISPRRETNEKVTATAGLNGVHLPLSGEQSKTGDTDFANSFTQGTSFADFAEKMGLTEIPDLLEAAAAHIAYIEGQPHFSRPQIMRQVADFTGKKQFDREVGLRSFGQLLRQGKIIKVKRGQFEIAATTRFKPEPRIAGE